MPQGSASVEAATGAKRELMKAPSGGEKAPFSRFTRRKREVFDFAESDRAKSSVFAYSWRTRRAGGSLGDGVQHDYSVRGGKARESSGSRGWN
jgi:hypothetical protein